MKDLSKMSTKFHKFAHIMQTNKYLKAISEGLMSTLPLLLLGSLSLLLGVIPIKPWQSLITQTEIKKILLLPNSLATGCLSLYVSFLVAYKLSRNFDEDGLLPGIVSIFNFLLVTPMVTTEEGSMISMNWLGVQGLFTALIVGLVSARLYVFILKKDVIIKMPEGVPDTVSNTFSGMLPAMTASVFFMIISGIFSSTHFNSFTEAIYTVFQIPLSGLGNNVWSLFLIVLFQMVLWFFGIHGSLVVSTVISVMFLPMDVENLVAFGQGVAGSDLPNILGKAFYNIFSGIGGAGGTLGLCILLTFVAKSKQLRTLGRLALIPSFFTINEPLIFGVPLILNPVMIIPFMTVPLVQTIVAYLAITSGLVPRLAGVQAPFGIPVFINGFMQGSWKISVLQLVLIVISVLIYYPFFKKLDNDYYQKEKLAATE